MPTAPDIVEYELDSFDANEVKSAKEPKPKPNQISAQPVSTLPGDRVKPKTPNRLTDQSKTQMAVPSPNALASQM